MTADALHSAATKRGLKLVLSSTHYRYDLVDEAGACKGFVPVLDARMTRNPDKTLDLAIAAGPPMDVADVLDLREREVRTIGELVAIVGASPGVTKVLMGIAQRARLGVVEDGKVLDAACIATPLSAEELAALSLVEVH